MALKVRAASQQWIKTRTLSKRAQKGGKGSKKRCNVKGLIESFRQDLSNDLEESSPSPRSAARGEALRGFRDGPQSKISSSDEETEVNASSRKSTIVSSMIDSKDNETNTEKLHQLEE